MRFEEPEVLVQFARDAGKKIGGDFVAEIVALVDGLAKRVGVVRHIVDEPLKLGSSVGSGEIGFFQAALRGGFASGAIGYTAQSDDAFGDSVCVFFQMAGDGIEQ